MVLLSVLYQSCHLVVGLVVMLWLYWEVLLDEDSLLVLVWLVRWLYSEVKFLDGVFVC
jgi:hypothetical protein